AGHLTQQPLLTMLPEAERSVVARALAKKPEERWPCCRAFVEALHAPPPSHAWTRKARGSSQPEAIPTRGQRLTNSVGMSFGWVEGGSFLRGSPAGNRPRGAPAERERNEDETPHRVVLTRGFYMGAHLVTQSQWEQVMGPGGHRSYFMGKDEEEKQV